MATSYEDITAGAPTLPETLRRLIELANLLGIPIEENTFGLADPTWVWLQLTPRLVYAILAAPLTQMQRAMFIDLATDPGDEGHVPADDTLARPGVLSVLGEGWYGTTRGGATYATTTVTIRNDGASSAVFKPGELSFTTQAPEPVKADGGRPTYKNSPDGAIYTGVGGTVTINVGASLTIPIACEQLGTYGSAAANAIVYTGSSAGAVLTVTASALALGNDRESADLYRARCKASPSKFSRGSPAEKYTYAATSNNDGTKLRRHDGSGDVGITKVYVDQTSSSGLVRCYYADDDAAADGVDVASANANITGVPLGVITSPMNAIAECVTFVGAAAIEVNITVVGTANIKRRAGTSDAALKASAEAAIDVALTAYFAAAPIGGNDQTLGAGSIKTADFLGVIFATKVDGLYGLHAAAITTPAGSSTAIALGRVAKLAGSAPHITVTVVP